MDEFMEIRVEELRKGDRFVNGGRHHWTALEDARERTDLGYDKLVAALVRFADGGTSLRAWDPGVTIGVMREEAAA